MEMAGKGPQGCPQDLTGHLFMQEERNQNVDQSRQGDLGQGERDASRGFLSHPPDGKEHQDCADNGLDERAKEYPPERSWGTSSRQMAGRGRP